MSPCWFRNDKATTVCKYSRATGKFFYDARAGPAPARLLVQKGTGQAVSEFGLMQTHGRTMESNGSACLGWDEETVASTIGRLRERLPGINPVFEKIRDEQWRVWVYGILHRYRERGALSHEYLAPYAKMGFWGKYPFGRAIPGRETYPSAIHYKPRLLVTAPQRNHEHILASTRGGQSPWHVVWTYRALGEPPAAEADLIDLVRALLVCGAAAGLFKKLNQDGNKVFYAISSDAARLYPNCVRLVCDETDRGVARPEGEAEYWKNAPSMEYYATEGRYRIRPFDPRQRYYQDRYRKGALRRVVASEHTGLLETDEREKVESRFKRRSHEDDPNVLTCTSTLEMGIDIGDLSTAMLCSIPPDTASYLQRIGRAGRATGTALIVSVVNQRPHDLFFYARPVEMLKGKVDPPGCWLDASAVLVRQYLGFCFDSGTREGTLPEIPRTGPQLVDDLKNPDGRIPLLMRWVTQNEAELRHRFIRHFLPPVQEDTKEPFQKETDTQLLIQRMHQAAYEFDRTRRELENARSRLNDQLKQLDEEEKDARVEILQELKILKGRINGLSRTTALEILTDSGLLPNYAFLYTHRRQFEIQQIAIGNSQQLLTEVWAICGVCGHMRRIEELKQPDATPACPQCGHSGDNRSQLDLGQQRQFVEFAQSQAFSYMEHYESLSGDRDEERRRGFYDVIVSFDQTKEKSSGAVGDDELPFGIEYRSSMILREINTGYINEVKNVPFGPDTCASENGFWICRDCGVAIPPDQTPESVDPGIHRRSCHARRKHEKMRQEGKTGNPFHYLPLYLYRELKSEAIRLLLPLADDEDIHTLVASIYLGLRLRFEGNPAHLIVQPQILPDAGSGLTRHYLVIMDAVPGGTGFLKTLYQEKDEKGRAGEGIMDVLRRSRDALETCRCRNLAQQGEQEDTDGCYRCIRSYHMQYKAGQISRERGIKLLNSLIESGGKRIDKGELESIKPDSLFGSVLEKKFVESLQAFVEERKGKWGETIVKGGKGFRFSLPDSDRVWDIELQPSLGPAQGVVVPSRPDFLIDCDDESVRPTAIFTDGFEFHCCPNNRLADDFKKRRAIFESGGYRVWSVSWEDLASEKNDHPMACHPKLVEYLDKCRRILSEKKHKGIPDAFGFSRNGMEQLKTFVSTPDENGWKLMAEFALFWPLQMLAEKQRANHDDLQEAIGVWRKGGGMKPIEYSPDGDWIYNERASLTKDFIAYVSTEDALVNAKEQVGVVGRLGDAEEETTGSDFKERWRRFLACMNVYQFNGSFRFWTSSEAVEDDAGEIRFEGKFTMGEEWKSVFEDTIKSLRPLVEALAKTEIPIPWVEYVNEAIEDDAFAELAWEFQEKKIAILAGDQIHFASAWQNQGWKTILPSDIEAKGICWSISTRTTKPTNGPGTSASKCIPKRACFSCSTWKRRRAPWKPVRPFRIRFPPRPIHCRCLEKRSFSRRACRSLLYRRSRPFPPTSRWRL